MGTKAKGTKPTLVLRGGTDPSPAPQRKSKRQLTRAEQLAIAASKLIAAAASEALAADIGAGREAYPAHMMPLSKCGTLNADPNTMANYNPTGELGDRRHTPRHNVREEDMIDRTPPRRAQQLSQQWPSSGGAVVDALSLLRNAARVNRTSPSESAV